MIVVKIELWPFGAKDLAKEIGRMYIANDGTGDHKRGNYNGGICRRNSTKITKPFLPEGAKPIRQGRVENYPRKSYNVWRLVFKMLKSCFPEES